jgi:hypothetical protein
MRKFKLESDALRVESFETHASGSGSGTVRGHAQECSLSGQFDCGQTANSTNGGEVCICFDSWDATCVKCRTDEATCSNSCWGTCTCP